MSRNVQSAGCSISRLQGMSRMPIERLPRKRVVILAGSRIPFHRDNMAHFDISNCGLLIKATGAPVAPGQKRNDRRAPPRTVGHAASGLAQHILLQAL